MFGKPGNVRPGKLKKLSGFRTVRPGGHSSGGWVHVSGCRSIGEKALIPLYVGLGLRITNNDSQLLTNHESRSLIIGEARKAQYHRITPGVRDRGWQTFHFWQIMRGSGYELMVLPVWGIKIRVFKVQNRKWGRCRSESAMKGD